MLGESWLPSRAISLCGYEYQETEASVYLWCAAADLASWVHKLYRIEQSAATVTLVSSCVGKVAFRAGALNKAIRQELIASEAE